MKGLFKTQLEKQEYLQRIKDPARRAQAAAQLGLDAPPPAPTPKQQQPKQIAVPKRKTADWVISVPAMAVHKRKKGQGVSIEHRLVGYYTKGRRNSKHPRAQMYNRWKDHVRAHLPAELQSGINANHEGCKAELHILHAYFPTRTHCDVENLRKGLVDVVFGVRYPGHDKRYENKDKWVSGSIPWPEYDPGDPRVIFQVKVHGHD